MTFNEYVLFSERQFHKSFPLRRGQVYFNVLCDFRPDISERVRGAIFDPFYKDDNLNTFLQFVGTNW